MDTLELLAQQRVAVSSRLTELRDISSALNQALGLDKEIEKAGASLDDSRAEISKYKADLAEVMREKAAIVSSASEALAAKMAKVLPFGTAVFEVTEDGKVFLGWEVEPGKVVAAGGLSGGQTVMFGAALANALLDAAPAPIITVEAAEVGPEIGQFLEHIASQNPKAQIIAATCFPVEETPGWDVRAV